MHPLLAHFKDFALKKSIADNVFVVGGGVRDMLSGVPTKDIDIALAGDALGISREFADASGGTYVLLDREFATARIVKGHFSLDISAMRGGSIISDLSDRDITINAMAQPLCEWESTSGIIDPCGGLDDLESRIIRMVSENNLINDPLRILRVYRFSAAMNASIENETRRAAREHCNLLSGVSVERVAVELRHIMGLSDSHKILKIMDEDGIIPMLFPEAVAGQGIECCRKSEEILGNPGCFFPDHAQRFSAYFESPVRKTSLKLSALFSGSAEAREAALRLKMSGKETGLVASFSKGCAEITSLFRASAGRTELIRFLKHTQETIYPVVVLAAALDRSAPMLSYCNSALSLYTGEVIPRLGLLGIVTGDDLIKEFGLTPSPEFKRILSGLEDDILMGEVGTREEALRKIRDSLGIGS